MTSKSEPLAPDQESVWDYPRPPRLEEFTGRIRMVFNGKTVANTTNAKRVLETSHPPVYYIPPDDIDSDFLKTTEGESWCEWKGTARYFDIECGDMRAEKAAWYYPRPTQKFASIAGHVAFYSDLMDACYVNDELVRSQPGRFYGGWITSNILGPFKGGSGTSGW